MLLPASPNRFLYSPFTFHYSASHIHIRQDENERTPYLQTDNLPLPILHGTMYPCTYNVCCILVICQIPLSIFQISTFRNRWEQKEKISWKLNLYPERDKTYKYPSRKLEIILANGKELCVVIHSMPFQPQRKENGKSKWESEFVTEKSIDLNFGIM